MKSTVLELVKIVEMDATRLVKGSAYLVAQSIVTMIMRVVAFAFMARILTQTEMGVAVAFNLILGIAQVLSDLGFSGGLTKYVAEYKGKNVDYTSISFTAVLTKASMAGSAATICVLTASRLSGFLLGSIEYTFLFQLLSIYLLMFCLDTTVNHLLLGVNRIREIAILRILSTVVAKASIIGLLMHGFGLAGLVTGWTLGGLAYTILGTLIIVKDRYVRIHPIREVIPKLKKLAKFSWPLFLTDAVIFLYNWFDQALLLAYVPLSEVAVYGVAIQAFTLLTIIPVALNTTLLPYYSEQYGKDEQQKIVAGVQGSSRYIALLYTPLAMGLVATAGPVISLFAGSTYASGGEVLAILCLFGGLNGLAASFGSLLLVYEMTPTVLLINIVSVVGSSVMSPVMLPFFGVIGMAVIKGTAMIISLVLTAIALQKHVPMEFDREVLWKSWCASIIMCAIVWLTEHIYYSPHLLPLYVAMGGTVYMIALRLLKAVNENDIKLVRNLLGKRANVITHILEKALV